MNRLFFTVPALIVVATLALTNSSDAAKGGGGRSSGGNGARMAAPKAAPRVAPARPVSPGRPLPGPGARGNTFRDASMPPSTTRNAPESFAPSTHPNTTRPTGPTTPRNPGGQITPRTFRVFIQSPVTGQRLLRGTYATSEEAGRVAAELRDIFGYQANVPDLD